MINYRNPKTKVTDGTSARKYLWDINVCVGWASVQIVVFDVYARIPWGTSRFCEINYIRRSFSVVDIDKPHNVVWNGQYMD